MSKKKLLLYLVVIVLLAVALIPKREQLIAGIDIAKTADISWILLAVVALVGTYFAAAFIYLLLAKKTINYLITVSVQIASSFANRLLPGGIGGLGLNIDYLIKNKHKPAESTSVVAMSSMVALVSHIVLVVIALTISKSAFNTIFSDRQFPWWLVVLVLVIASLVIIFLSRHKALKRKINKLLKATWQNFVNYRQKPGRIIVSVLIAAVVTAFYVFAFYACSYAVGLPITVVQAFLIYTLGTLVGAAALTPGGLGGVEAGLVAGLVAVDADYGLAFSVVIIYRLVTFWLPIVPGYAAFWLLRRNKKI